MKTALQFKIIAGLGFALALTLVISIVTYHSTIQLTEDAAASKRSEEVLIGLALIVSSLSDAEAGEREYTSIGDATFLESYRQAVARVDSHFQKLRQLTVDRPQQQQRLDSLEPLLTGRLTHINQAIEVRRTEGFAAAQNFVASGKGKHIQAAIRTVISELELAEHQMLEQRDTHAQATAHRTLTLIATSSIAMLLLISAMVITIYRGFKVLSQTQASLYSVNEELRSATEKAQVSERITSTFLDTMSHELRTPLSSLLGFTELMLNRPLSAEKQRQFLEILHKESQHLSTLINDFLDLQRLASNRIRFEFAVIDVVDVMHEVALLFSHDQGHPLILNLPDQLPTVRADRDRLKQVLHNLLSNAVKFSPQGGEIVFSARADPAGRIEFVVQDHGLGIPQDALPKLFAKFYRVDSGDRSVIGGTGLGLALCKEIVEAHGSKIAVASVLGQGSIFSFALPMAAELSQLPVEQNLFDALVVEDDATFAMLLREHLSETGLRVRIESTGEGAINALRTTQPRIILLDVQLAGPMDGWDFLTEVKSDPRLAPIPVIITTITEKRSRGLALGASGYLVKPFPMETLLALVRQHLPSLSGKPLLVVDDDPVFRRAIVEMLHAEFDCQVDEAADGREALERLAQSRPGLIVLDLMMPDVDGFAVLDSVRLDPATAELPILVMTGKNLTPEDKQRLQRGMARVLTKSDYKREHLLTLVRQLLDAPRNAGHITGSAL